jgi:hypothetical protein
MMLKHWDGSLHSHPNVNIGRRVDCCRLPGSLLSGEPSAKRFAGYAVAVAIELATPGTIFQIPPGLITRADLRTSQPRLARPALRNS